MNTKQTRKNWKCVWNWKYDSKRLLLDWKCLTGIVKMRM